MAAGSQSGSGQCEECRPWHPGGWLPHQRKWRAAEQAAEVLGTGRDWEGNRLAPYSMPSWALERSRANASPREERAEGKKGDAVCRSSLGASQPEREPKQPCMGCLPRCVCNSLRQARRAVLGCKLAGCGLGCRRCVMMERLTSPMGHGWEQMPRIQKRGRTHDKPPPRQRLLSAVQMVETQ